MNTTLFPFSLRLLSRHRGAIGKFEITECTLSLPSLSIIEIISRLPDIEINAILECKPSNFAAWSDFIDSLEGQTNCVVHLSPIVDDNGDATTGYAWSVFPDISGFGDHRSGSGSGIAPTFWQAYASIIDSCQKINSLA